LRFLREKTGTRGLKEEAGEQLDRNHRENRASGQESETDHRRHKHSPRKRRNGGMKSSLKEEVMWHIDPLLVNGREKNKEKTTVARQRCAQ
jgi:hypothetical protein